MAESIAVDKHFECRPNSRRLRRHHLPQAHYAHRIQLVMKRAVIRSAGHFTADR